MMNKNTIIIIIVDINSSSSNNNNQSIMILAFNGSRRMFTVIKINKATTTTISNKKISIKNFGEV